MDRKTHTTKHILYIFLALNRTLYNLLSPSISEHFRVDCRFPEKALHLVILLSGQQEVVICGELLLYAAVFSAKGKAFFFFFYFSCGARAIKSLARRWAPAIRISLAVKDNVVILEASPWSVPSLRIHTVGELIRQPDYAVHETGECSLATAAALLCD